MRVVSVSKTLAAAGNYADNDVVSESATTGTAWVFRDIIPQRGDGNRSGAMLLGGTVTCNEDSLLWALRLHLFNAVPSAATMLNDNEALALDNDDRANYVGYVDFAAMVDHGEFSLTQVRDWNLGVHSGSGTLWGVLQATEAETNETAGMIMTITLYTVDNG